MKTTRHSVFETNSSSSHSISIATASGKLLSSLPLDGSGNLVLNGGEFGWEEETYSDALTKANYCAVDASYANGDTLTKMLVKVLKEQTGAKDVVFNFTNDYSVGSEKPLASIDHLSVGVATPAFESEETLRQFIFDPRSTLTTDHDNH